MAVDESLRDVFAQMSATREKQRTGRDLSGGGGDGTSGDMDVRIAKLEASMAHAERDIGELRSDMKTVLADVAVLKATAATKTDLAALGDKLITRMQIYMGIIAALIVAATAVTKFL